jgi:hypothetical protein
MWWKSVVKFSFFLCFAACRMRPSEDCTASSSPARYIALVVGLCCPHLAQISLSAPRNPISLFIFSVSRRTSFTPSETMPPMQSSQYGHRRLDRRNAAILLYAIDGSIFRAFRA